MNILENVDLSTKSNWRIGGNCRYFITVNSNEELIMAIKFADNKSLNYIIIGRTSNILFTDNYINGCIITFGSDYSRVAFEGNALYATTSVFIPYLVKMTINKGLKGLEHLIGVPASFGGAIYMNAGSQRRSLSSNIVSVDILDENLEFQTIKKNNCDFNYRYSTFQKKANVILGARLLLEDGIRKDLNRNCLNILKNRNAKFPRKEPSCGSVFISNPEMYDEYGPPGKLIEDIGYKGFNYKGAKVSDKHANFIVNYKSAKAEDILYLVQMIIKDVFEYSGHKMKPEFKYLDSDCILHDVSDLAK
ncbi:UDP-N-acetylmuramate dehydrogenase [Vibrio breoganii]|uniref:UDP-N-acetylmuramate dehydrogenase n=1 Tax=Vibrio breoganii TaxID=553239 RepID=UPI000C848B9B|nr:UDP-N-acetylmuramate dehydrogenase [Vibrio breoganii]PMG95094.1 UDP-N-acetylenolpyruvoylglucosamine reductase [Vibrio breoganii]